MDSGAGRPAHGRPLGGAVVGPGAPAAAWALGGPEMQQPSSLSRGARSLSLLLVVRQSHANRGSANSSFGGRVFPRRGAAAAARSRQELWLQSEPARLQLPRALAGPSTSSAALLHSSPFQHYPHPRGPVSTLSPPFSTPSSFLPARAPRVPALHLPCHLQLGHSRGGAHGPLLQALLASLPAAGGTAALRDKAVQAGRGREDQRERGWRCPEAIPRLIWRRRVRGLFHPDTGHRNSAGREPELTGALQMH